MHGRVESKIKKKLAHLEISKFNLTGSTSIKNDRNWAKRVLTISPTYPGGWRLEPEKSAETR